MRIISGFLGVLLMVSVAAWAIFWIGDKLDATFRPEHHAAAEAAQRAKSAAEAAAQAKKDAIARAPEEPPKAEPVQFIPPQIPRDAPVNPAMISGDRYANMDRLTTWAVLVGRGMGCKFDTDLLSHRVYAWIYAVTEDDDHRADRSTLIDVWVEGQRQNAMAQLDGSSPDTCAGVARGLEGHQWP